MEACFSKTLYKQRNLVERFSSKSKHFRRIATRYNERADHSLAMVKLASMHMWLRPYGFTAWFIRQPRRNKIKISYLEVVASHCAPLHS